MASSKKVSSRARPLPIFSPETRVRPGTIIISIVAIGLGIVAESVAFSWDDPARWLPDLIVGWSFIACALYAWESAEARGQSILMAMTGIGWFLGNFSPALLYLHRGPLVHLLLTYAGWRVRSRLDLIALVTFYAAALATPVWRNEFASLALALMLVVVTTVGYVTAVGRTRRDRLTGLQAAVAVAAALAGGSVARLAVQSGNAAEPALLVYEVALVAVAIRLLLRLGEHTTSALADLVVELGETQSGTLRQRLAVLLGDPSLEIGYWSTEAGVYVNEEGTALALPERSSMRSATFVERMGEPFAVLEHDATVLGDPALVEAVATATRLAASNVALQVEVQSQMAELTASRRRLLVAADDERRRLELRLREGPERRLSLLAELLSKLSHHGGVEQQARVERARDQLEATLEELHELARGLHPRELVEAGLRGALASLAERCPARVTLEVRVSRLDHDIEATVYFFCAEALTNVAKYASASQVRLTVAMRDGYLTVAVEDDGIGGADISRGTGLQGLADRVEALDGTMRIISPPGQGTRLAAEIALGGESR
jgi:signal transduction histidine kinase